MIIATAAPRCGRGALLVFFRVGRWVNPSRRRLGHRVLQRNVLWEGQWRGHLFGDGHWCRVLGSQRRTSFRLCVGVGKPRSGRRARESWKGVHANMWKVLGRKDISVSAEGECNHVWLSVLRRNGNKFGRCGWSPVVVWFSTAGPLTFEQPTQDIVCFWVEENPVVYRRVSSRPTAKRRGTKKDRHYRRDASV